MTVAARPAPWPAPISTLADVRRIEAQPASAFMPHATVYDALAAVAARHPARRALGFLPDADPATPAQVWTFAELLADIRRTANLFQALVPGEVPRVAMLLPAVPQAHLTLWAAETAGLCCPINHLLDAAHIAELVRAAQANLLVVLGPHPALDIWSRVPAVRAACPGLREVLAVGGAPGCRNFEQAVAAAPADDLQFTLRRDADRTAALFHTGGTTGAPKLARHTQRNQLHAAWGAAGMFGMSAQDVVLNGFPMFHVAGTLVFGLSALLSGAAIVQPTALGLRNPEVMARYWALVARQGVTLLGAVPTVMATLLGQPPAPGQAAGVRALLTGGSPLPAGLAASFERQHGIPVRNILGMTESAGVVSIEPCGAARTPGSCGLPLPFTEVVAVAPDGRRCAAGESGVLRLRGPQVSPGYTDPRRNAGTFDADGWLTSGDIGHVDAEGRVFVTGRAKDVIIRGGHNIDPQWIEEALLQHPAVAMAAAVGAPDEQAGELPMAFVALRPGAAADPAALSVFANERIPERPAWPKRIVVLPALPLTAVGKVYKPRLRAEACALVLHERLAAAGLAQALQVHVDEHPHGLALRFVPRRPGAGLDRPALVQRLAALMHGFALAHTLDDPAGGGAAGP